MAVSFKYAGFWRRFIALFIDVIIFNILLSLLIGILQVTMQPGLTGINFLAPLGLLYFVYAAIFESSSWQATPGKRILSLKIVDYEGNAVGFLRAFGRNVGKIVSTIILWIGFVMAAFTSRKQALHDMMAGCLVIRSI